MANDCTKHLGKQAHQTKTEATAHVINARRRGHNVRVYKCPKCSLWFIGGSRLSKAERLWSLIDKLNEQ
jgi:hypothetical protein